MVIVGAPRVERTRDFVIFRNLWVLHIVAEVFVDLVPEVAQFFQSCPKPLGFWFWPYGALPIGPMGPYKGPDRALVGPYYGPIQGPTGPTGPQQNSGGPGPTTKLRGPGPNVRALTSRP